MHRHLLDRELHVAELGPSSGRPPRAWSAARPGRRPAPGSACAGRLPARADCPRRPVRACRARAVATPGRRRPRPVRRIRALARAPREPSRAGPPGGYPRPRESCSAAVRAPPAARPAATTLTYVYADQTAVARPARDVRRTPRLRPVRRSTATGSARPVAGRCSGSRGPDPARPLQRRPAGARGRCARGCSAAPAPSCPAARRPTTPRGRPSRPPAGAAAPED